MASHVSETMGNGQNGEDASHSPRQPPFLALPFEIRELVYQELWKSEGLVQHVFCHQDPSNYKNAVYCTWPCSTSFSVEGTLQNACQSAWQRKGEPTVFNSPGLRKKLLSMWMNHWECEAKVFEAAFMARRVTPEEEWFCGCAMAQFRTKKPFLPMLLTCKKTYAECVESIYKSITFVFLDQVTLERFFGTCAKPTLAISPFLRYTPRVEISLPVSFTQLQACSYDLDTNHGHWRPENFLSPPLADTSSFPHAQYDFHWLRVAELQRCRQINIWIDSQLYVPPPRLWFHRPRAIHQLTRHELHAAISTVGEKLNPRCEMVITSALSGGVGPEFGYLTGDDIFHPKVRVWKRYVGDLFLAGYGRRFPSLGAIVYSPQRYVAYVP